MDSGAEQLERNECSERVRDRLPLCRFLSFFTPLAVIYTSSSLLAYAPDPSFHHTVAQRMNECGEERERESEGGKEREKRTMTSINLRHHVSPPSSSAWISPASDLTNLLICKFASLAYLPLFFTPYFLSSSSYIAFVCASSPRHLDRKPEGPSERILNAEE
ncbi:hypothetical protein NMY22_g19924 [Coprinellus aureogranulatus]|nr:hypothetical protein NMY22_g19924 [Coprinellus aureogranulatus]